MKTREEIIEKIRSVKGLLHIFMRAEETSKNKTEKENNARMISGYIHEMDALQWAIGESVTFWTTL